jgi:hypothetical protein
MIKRLIRLPSSASLTQGSRIFMIIKMRTTVVLSDRLFKAAKREAANRGVSLSQLINEALSASLTVVPEPDRPFEVVTYGGSGHVRHEPEDFAKLLEDDDRRPSRRR